MMKQVLKKLKHQILVDQDDIDVPLHVNLVFAVIMERRVRLDELMLEMRTIEPGRMWNRVDDQRLGLGDGQK